MKNYASMTDEKLALQYAGGDNSKRRLSRPSPDCRRVSTPTPASSRSG